MTNNDSLSPVETVRSSATAATDADPMVDSSTPSSSQETHAQSESTIAQHRDQCPECSGDLVTDDTSAERRCAECGLVVEVDQIDQGPDWRAYSAEEREKVARASPLSELMHDKGLSTQIDWRNQDGYGNSLSKGQRKKVSRLRTWQQRSKNHNSTDRTLKQAIGEIRRMGSALGLPRDIKETATVIYRQILDQDLHRGRSIEGLSSAALYAAAKDHGVARTPDEIEQVSRVGLDEINGNYRFLLRELNLEQAASDPEEFLPRYMSKLKTSLDETKISDATEHEARALLAITKELGIHSGKAPSVLAAGAIYGGAKLANDDVTQAEISSVSGVSKVSLRHRYREMVDAQKEHPDLYYEYHLDD